MKMNNRPTALLMVLLLSQIICAVYAREGGNARASDDSAATPSPPPPKDVRGTVAGEAQRHSSNVPPTSCNEVSSGGATGNFMEKVTTPCNIEDSNTVEHSEALNVNENAFLEGPGPWTDVKAFGAKGDGTTDDTVAINSAIGAVGAAGGGCVYFPPGQYVISANIVVKSGVTLCGNERFAPGPTFQISSCGSTLPCFIVSTGKGGTSIPAFTMEAFSGAKGFALLWPGQSTSNAPVLFGWVFTTNGSASQDRVVLRDLMLVNPYLGIYENYGGQWEIENVYGQPISIGLKMDQVHDVSVVRNVHWWSFWQNPSAGISQYIQAHGIGFQIEDVDQVLMSDVFAYGMNRMFDFENLDGHGTPWISISNVLGDVCNQCVFINAANQILFENSTFTGGMFGIIAANSADIGTRAVVAFSNTHVENSWGGADIGARSGQFMFSNFSGGGASDGTLQVVGGSDLLGPLVLNEGNEDANGKAAVVTISNDTHHANRHSSIWGTGGTILDGVPFPDQANDITPAGFSTPSSWGSNGCVTPSGNGSAFNLTCPVQGVSFAVPASLRQEVGLFTLSFSFQVSISGPTGHSQFYFRIRDAANNIYMQWPDYAFAIERLGTTGTVNISVPFVVPPGVSDLVFEFVFGGSSASSMIVTVGASSSRPLKIFRSSYPRAAQGIVPYIYKSSGYLDPLNAGLRLRFAGTNRETWQAAAPTAGTHVAGDLVWNTNPTEQGKPGSKYVVAGWVCTAGGTPGTWVQRRELTGN